MPQPQESCMNSILATCAQLKNSLKRLMEPLARQQGVNMAQMLLLCGIHSGVIANVNSACRWLDMGQGNTSTLCKRLEEQGFLLRRRSHEDERVVQLSLTAKGRQTVLCINQQLDALSQRLLQVSPQLYQRLQDSVAAANELAGLLPLLIEAEQTPARIPENEKQ